MCRRSEGEETHSVRRFQASWRETPPCMVVTVAEPPRTAPRRPPARARRRALQPTGSLGSLRREMEKFVIEGGVPLSGTIQPAGNKNGALPIIAAALLTEDEVILRNVPRIRDVEAMLALLEALGSRVAWLGPS